MASKQRLGCVLFFVAVLGLVVSTSSAVIFPYTIVLPKYNVTWRDARPVPEISILLPNTTKPISLLAIDGVSRWVELQGPPDVEVYKTGNEFAAKVANSSIVIQNITSPTYFDVVEINRPNVQGLSYTATLSNGANVLINWTVNAQSDVSLPIPRSPSDQFCELPNRFEGNCTCAPNHTIPIDSLKFTISVTNWTFAPFRPGMNVSYLAEDVFLTAPFNLEYYLLANDSTDLLHFDSCDVAYTNMNMSQGEIIVKFSLFSNFFRDQVPNQISSVIGMPGFDQNSGLVVLPFTFFYPATEGQQELLFDPDFSVFFGKDNSGGSSGGGAGDGDRGGGGELSGGAIAGIVIGVFIGTGIIIVLIILALVAVAVVRSKKLSKRPGTVHV